ncbi:hypothetical protein UFOVP1339_27 [uncultured Caudovirales phage]|uniref:Uncharacterized protein n=1 Tax=uncultured Caudovirales phage TaxID=2100421 RepID=A0A6J5S1E1_9CAUD|nr:hypothetical protein UFOVP1339_27 [uncultured Caudovirales phage]
MTRTELALLESAISAIERHETNIGLVVLRDVAKQARAAHEVEDRLNDIRQSHLLRRGDLLADWAHR